MAQVLADNKELVKKFYDLSNGSVENIGILLRFAAHMPFLSSHDIFGSNQQQQSHSESRAF